MVKDESRQNFFGGWGGIRNAYGVVDTKRGMTRTHAHAPKPGPLCWVEALLLSALSFGHLQSRFLVVMPRSHRLWRFRLIRE